MIRIALFALWILCYSFNKQPGHDFSAIDRKITAWVDSGYYTGAGLVIVKDGKVVHEQYYGSNTANSVVYIASAGKWLAAAAVAAVVEEGKISCTDPVKKWIPSFTDEKGNATLRQLFSHTAGYPDYLPSGQRPDNYQTLRESIVHIQPLPADSVPGALFHYGGLAMQVGGRMAELATGKDWETIFQEKIARPLGMTSTTFTPVDETPGHSPMLAGGARTTLPDYIRFLEMFAGNGMFRGKRILSEYVVHEMMADQVGDALVSPDDNFLLKGRGATHKGVYGFGLWREELDAAGNATLITSPSWAGAYPWIDRKNKIYGFFIAHVNPARAAKTGFSSFYASYALPIMAREAIQKDIIP